MRKHGEWNKGYKMGDYKYAYGNNPYGYTTISRERDYGRFTKEEKEYWTAFFYKKYQGKF